MSVFRVHGALDPLADKTFVGRSAEYRHIAACVQQSPPSYVAVFGARQTGKTSFLRGLPMHLSGLCRLVYLDFQPLKAAGFAKCYQHIAQEFARQLGFEDLAAHVEDGIGLLPFLEMLANHCDAERIVVACDELGGLPNEVRLSFANSVRSVFHATLDRKPLSKFVFVFAGALELWELVSGGTEVSPLNIVEKIYLADLSRDETQKLIQEGLGRLGTTVDQRLPLAIYRHTQGHPYLTQKICWLLETRLPSALSNNDVEEVVGTLFREGDTNLEHIARLVHESSPLLRTTLADIIETKTIVSFDRNIPLVTKLELMGVVRNEGGKCVVRTRLHQRLLKSLLVNAGQGTNDDMTPFVVYTFERKVGEYIKEHFNYSEVEISWEPPFLVEEGGEIDLYAYDTHGTPRRSLVCECKSRLKGNPDEYPITTGEVLQLARKVKRVKEKESAIATERGYSVRVEGWLISNTAVANLDAVKLAREHGISLKRACLPKDWKTSTKWAVGDLQLVESVCLDEAIP